MSIIAQYKQKLRSYIQSLQTHPSLQFFQRQHKIKLSQKLTPALDFIIIFILLIFPFQIITILFGFIYPAYLTILTFQTPNEESQNRILTYWIMFGFTEIIAPIPEYVIGWFFWYLIRVGFLWMLLKGRYQFTKGFQKWVLLKVISENKKVDNKQKKEEKEKQKEKSEQLKKQE